MPPPPSDRRPARIQIERPEPALDCGRYAVKRSVGDTLEVSADIFRDGHEVLRAVVRHRGPEASGWTESTMARVDASVGGDRWTGSFEVTACGRWSYSIAAWHDPFASWCDELARKLRAGQRDLAGELSEGAVLLEQAQTGARDDDRELIEQALTFLRSLPPVAAETTAPATAPGSRRSRGRRALKARSAAGHDEAAYAAVLRPELLAAVERSSARAGLVTLPEPLPLEVDPVLARFSSWYELFPRSFGGFAGVERVLPEIARLGFDVLYLPPIHPIGVKNRKGPNNSLVAGPDDPGSPWAIGAAEGGHSAVHPDLGTLEDFDRMVARADELGVAVALDFAIQCSADHPWLSEHPEWFHRRPDGTLKYAENPPKRYQDIYNVNFDSDDWPALWQALLDVVLHWVSHGVKIFRVDNPHTKPLPFWQWLIAGVHRHHPDVIMLAEAFTRTTMMRALAKVGFNQSYTYFTWKNSRAELTEYVTELACSGMQEYYRPNFFANTPDILHAYLQHGGRPAFEARLVLAATLSPAYGIYSGFEHCENVPVHTGSEEYLDSEKYEIKQRSLDGPLLPLIASLNAIRRANPALQRLDNITFLETENDALIAYTKRSPGNAVICVVSIDPDREQQGLAVLPASLGLPPVCAVTDLLDGERYDWRIGRNYVRLGPRERMAHVLRVDAP